MAMIIELGAMSSERLFVSVNWSLFNYENSQKFKQHKKETYPISFIFLRDVIMLLSDEEHFTIVLSAIRDCDSDTDVSVLIVEKVVAQIINCVNTQFTAQDILDEIVEIFDFYNTFIKAKKIDIKPIPDDMKDLIEKCINEVIDDVTKDNKKQK